MSKVIDMMTTEQKDKGISVRDGVFVTDEVGEWDDEYLNRYTSFVLLTMTSDYEEFKDDIADMAKVIASLAKAMLCSQLSMKLGKVRFKTSIVSLRCLNKLLCSSHKA